MTGSTEMPTEAPTHRRSRPRSPWLPAERDWTTGEFPRAVPVLTAPALARNLIACGTNHG